jgi:hypothetical protein
MSEIQESKPNIFVVGQSSTGKSTTIRNLPKDKTIILNTECKKLPFPDAAEFKRQRYIRSYDDICAYFHKPVNDKPDPANALESDAEVVVIDSFTSMIELIKTESLKRKDGYAQWAWYADEVTRFVKLSKASDKYIVFTGIDEIEFDYNGVPTNKIKVEGKYLKGTIEKEFVIVLYCIVEVDGKDARYLFLTNTDGTRPAKTPMDMFADRKIDNDLAVVIQAAEEYYQKPEVENVEQG